MTPYKQQEKIKTFNLARHQKSSKIGTITYLLKPTADKVMHL